MSGLVLVSDDAVKVYLGVWGSDSELGLASLSAAMACQVRFHGINRQQADEHRIVHLGTARVRKSKDRALTRPSSPLAYLTVDGKVGASEYRTNE